MRLSIIVLFMAGMAGGSFGRELPPRFLGRWFFDEKATALEWPRRARTAEQRERFRKIGASLAPMHKRYGKPLMAFLNVSNSVLVARGGALNPRFEILDASARDDVAEIRARHFQIPDDDNPQEVLLRLELAGDGLSIEVWEEGKMTILYVLSRKRA